MLPVPFPMIAVVGPTAVGKTSLTLRLAQEIGGEIINVDSIQIYRWLDIGSAKPTKEERARVPHHLVDIRYPFEPFDAADFVHAAGHAANGIRRRGKAVILSGGTGMYLDALLKGLAPCSGAHPCLRGIIRQYLEVNGATCLHELLEEYDPDAASRLHVNDTYRVMRALEVVLSTGMPISAWHKQHMEMRTMHDGLSCILVGLMRPREELYRRIDRRVDEMLASGFVEEVRELLQKGCSPELKPLQSIGYRHIIRLLAGKASMRETIETMKRDTRRYAKRQITWFRGRNMAWFHPDELMHADSVWQEIGRRASVPLAPSRG